MFHEVNYSQPAENRIARFSRIAENEAYIMAYGNGYGSDKMGFMIGIYEETERIIAFAKDNMKTR